MVAILDMDEEEEKICKQMFNQHYFGTFRGLSNDIQYCYRIFKLYAQTIGSYLSKEYIPEYYTYKYIKVHHPEFI